MTGYIFLALFVIAGVVAVASFGVYLFREKERDRRQDELAILRILSGVRSLDSYALQVMSGVHGNGIDRRNETLLRMEREGLIASNEEPNPDYWITYKGGELLAKETKR